jgi:hypothetical protein
MDETRNPITPAVSRRTIVQTTAVAGAAAITAMRTPYVHAAGSENFSVRIGLIVCGGRSRRRRRVS